MGFSGVIIAALIGALAWIYQRAWDRQQVRIERYQAIIDSLPGFTQDRLNPDQIDEALKEIRRLWLFAPDDVIEAANAFIEAAWKGEPKRSALSKLVLAMRRDVSFKAVLFPRFSDQLEASDVGDIIAARRKPGVLGSRPSQEERERDQREEVGS
jgi:hypothetical protein